MDTESTCRKVQDVFSKVQEKTQDTLSKSKIMAGNVLSKGQKTIKDIDTTKFCNDAKSICKRVDVRTAAAIAVTGAALIVAWKFVSSHKDKS
jgi:hypothetical protein